MEIQKKGGTKQWSKRIHFYIWHCLTKTEKYAWYSKKSIHSIMSLSLMSDAFPSIPPEMFCSPAKCFSSHNTQPPIFLIHPKMIYSAEGWIFFVFFCIVRNPSHVKMGTISGSHFLSLSGYQKYFSDENHVLLFCRRITYFTWCIVFFCLR